VQKRVYLIRHGETDGTAEGRFLGSTDLPLNLRGAEQVRRLVSLLPAGLFAPGARTWCISSPLRRARQTAEAVAGRAGLPVVIDADLSEIDFGDWEGLTAAEVEARSPGALEGWRSPDDDAGFPGGETLREFDRRVARGRERILEQEAEAVLVFTHGGVVRGLACGLLGLGREGFWLFDVRPASVTRVDVFAGGATLSGLWSVEDWEAE